MIANQVIDKQQKKEIKERLEKRLELRQLSLYEALQEEISIDWFKQQNPAFMSLLTPDGMKEMINYIIIPGEPENKNRSFKIPMVATEILSVSMPKVFELMFTEDKTARGGCTVGWLIEYFWMNAEDRNQQVQKRSSCDQNSAKMTNYVVSGYVVRILNNLMIGNAHKVLEYLIKNCCPKMLGFLDSHSVAEFLLRLIIVEDLLLNSFIKERLELFDRIIEIYVQNTACQETLQNVNFMLCESFHRLWVMKNKELGRFVNSLFRVIEVVIDHDDKYEEEKMLPIIVKLLVNFNEHAPFLIMALYRKIYQKLKAIKAKRVKSQNHHAKPIEAFGSNNLHLLQSIEMIFAEFNPEFAKFLEKANIFPVIFSFVERFEWNNIVLVRIEKIVKSCLKRKNLKLYQFMLSPLMQSIKSWKSGLGKSDKGSFGRGYKGLLESICSELSDSYQNNSEFTQFVDSSQLTVEIKEATDLSERVEKESHSVFRVVNEIALPAYHPIAEICTVYDEFFAEAELINKRYQSEKPSDHKKHKQDETLTHQIENENQLVYQLLTQASPSDSSSSSNGSDESEKRVQNQIM